MGSLGLLALAAGLTALGLYIHKRNGYWIGFGLVLTGGIVLAVTAQGQWAAHLVGRIPYAPLIILVAGVAVIGYDIRDKRPDKAAVMLALFVPMFLALGVAQIPDAFAAIGNAMSHIGNDTATSSQGR